ncbi:MAG: hypothetical protein HY023_18540 [Chloroflexi bacterium]|nr:hypothetical protein [Chloroflexota bacterium]
MNLLANPSFEEGYYHWKNIPELAVPNKWDFWCAEQNTPRVERQDDPWLRPETVIWDKPHAPAEEAALFWLDGTYILKIFKGWGPTWAKLSQTVNLPAGRYVFTAPVYSDAVADYSKEGKKILAPDPISQEVRLTAGDADTGWIAPKFGQYTHHQLAFDAPGAEGVTVAVEVRGRWGLRNNGFFLDALSLDPAGSAPTPTPPVQPSPKSHGPAPEPSGPPAWETLDDQQRWQVVRELARRAGLVS